MIRIRYLQILLLTTATVVAAVQEEPTNNIDQQQQRDLQYIDDSYKMEPQTKCGITGFSIYNSSSNTLLPMDFEQYMSEYPQSKILLDTFPNKKLNIIANTDTSGCKAINKQIQCVKLSFGNFASAIEYKAPYGLYSNSNVTTIGTGQLPKSIIGSFYPLQAWVYNTTNCTIGTDFHTYRTDVQIVPKSKQIYRISPLRVTYNNVLFASIKPKYRLELVKKTCAFLFDAFQMGFTYKGSLSIDHPSYRCWGNYQLKKNTTNTVPTSFNTSNTRSSFSSSSSSLSSSSETSAAVGDNNNSTSTSTTIIYHIRTTFVIDQEISQYLNPDMPTKNSVVEYINKLFLNKYSVGAGAEDYYMSTMIKEQLTTTNPFTNYTTISL